MPILFFSEDIQYDLSGQVEVEQWLKDICKTNQQELTELNYIFCSDDYLLSINEKYLNHNYYTDIITFDHSDEPSIIEGDIFISIDRVKENSKIHQAEFDTELRRVMVHGLLHLIGYDDKSEEEKKLMREKEDTYLSLLKR